LIQFIDFGSPESRDSLDIPALSENLFIEVQETSLKMVNDQPKIHFLIKVTDLTLDSEIYLEKSLL
jgi:hypothetical protein